MAEQKRKIFLLVEGAKTDAALMERLLTLYQLDVQYEIVSYCTNIYTLYHEMFEENDPDEIDLLQLLKSREKNPERRALFDAAYSDILLVFDLDPQAPDFSPEKIQGMSEYFSESSDMGKLYINYPMVEAFYHMSAIPDPAYNDRSAALAELFKGSYKSRVNQENRNHDYRKFAVSRRECSIVIRQNIEKAWWLLGEGANPVLLPPEQSRILHLQLYLLSAEERISVLSTCPFFIADYNPALLSEP